LKNVGPIHYCEPPHAHSPGVASGIVAHSRATCALMSTTTTRDRGDRWGPMEWAQQRNILYRDRHADRFGFACKM